MDLTILKQLLYALVALGCTWTARAQIPIAPPETHAFQIKAEVIYRCFGGIPSKRRDSRTKISCDNKEYRKVFFNERVNLQIKQEPTPDNDPTLAGSLSRTSLFKGREFVFSMSLFKDITAGKPSAYRLRAIALDDEPDNHRQSEVLTRSSTVKGLNPIRVQYDSVGQPEEIHYSVTIEPAP